MFKYLNHFKMAPWFQKAFVGQNSLLGLVDLVSVVTERTVREIVQENWRMACEVVLASPNISKTSLFHIVRDKLQLHRVCSKRVHHHQMREQLLNQSSGESCVETNDCKGSKLNIVITADETVRYIDSLPTKRGRSVWKQRLTSPEKVRQTKSSRKVIFNHKGLVQQHVIPPQITANAEFYISVLTRLWRHTEGQLN